MKFDKLDLKSIIVAIDKDNLSVDQKLDAKAMVWILGETYLNKDSRESKVISVEKAFSNDLIAGTVDLALEVTNPITYPKFMVGKKILVDWKTTSAVNFGTDVRKRYINSWQWKIYCNYYNYNNPIDYFEYRLISKITGDTHEILLKNNSEISKQVTNYIKHVNKMRDSLISVDTEWPRHMPYACEAYARSCPYKNDCDNNNVIKGIPSEPFHYTTIENFLLCPERYRLREITAPIVPVEPGESSTMLGSAVHRGMEEMYKQLMMLQK
jgi:hypothetical protein